MKNIVLPEWELILSDALNWDIETVYSHDSIAEMALLKPITQKYYNTMKKVMHEAITKGVMIVCIKNQGYKRICPNEWYEQAKKRAQKGGKYLGEAHLILQNAPLLEMSEEARNNCILLSDKLIKQKYLLAGGVISIQDNKPRNILKVREGQKI